MGKHLRHPATVIAALALFVALGGGAAWAGGLISGSQIKNHSIPAKKLTKKAINSLHGARGPRGAPGTPGGPAGGTIAYTSSGATIAGWHAVSLSKTAAKTAITLTAPASFASATSYVCSGSDVTAKHTAANVTFTYTSGSQFQYSLAGGGSVPGDTVDIVCQGH
jgi:hypothetical protein